MNKKGFTLIELSADIATMGLLSNVVLVGLKGTVPPPQIKFQYYAGLDKFLSKGIMDREEYEQRLVRD
jgi:hypothetical protein